MGDTVTNVCAKFNYDWLHIDKVLGNWKSDNNKKKNKNVAAWLSGNEFVSDVVALRWARLLLGSVTVCGQVNHLGIKQPLRSTQPSIPPG